MKTGIILFFSLTILLTTSVFLKAQNWPLDYQLANTKYQEGESEAAYIAANMCLEKYLQEDGSLSLNYAAILHLMSSIAYEKGLYEEGIKHSSKEIEIYEELGTADLSLASAYYNLGALQILNNDFVASEGALLEALTIFKDYLPKNHYDIILAHWKVGSSLLGQEKTETAISHFKIGFELLGEPEEIDSDYLNAVYDYGIACYHVKDYSTAIKYLGETANIYESMGLENTTEYATVLLQISDCHSDNKGYENALVFIDKSIGVYQAIKDKEGEQQALKRKAVALQLSGKSDEAINIYSGSSDPASLNNAAAIAFNKGNLTEAEELYKKALDILKKDSISYKPFIEVGLNLANVYLSLNRTDETEALLSLVDSIFYSLSQPDSALLAALFVKKAQLFQKRNDYSGSDQFYTKAEEIIFNNSGEKSFEFIDLINNKAVLYQEQGLYGRCEELLNKALAIAATIDYPVISSINLNNNLAALYQEKGQYAVARNLLEENLSILENIKESPAIVGNAYRQSALLEIQLGNFEIAHQRFLAAENTFTSYLNADHPTMVQHAIDIARLYQAKGDYAGAEKQYIDAIAKMKVILGTEHPDYLAALNSIGVLYQTMGNYEEALKHFEISRQGYSNLYGPYHPGYATTIENISTSYQLQGKYDQVEDLLKEAIKIDKVIYGEEHPKYGITLNNLAALYLKQDKFDLAKPYFIEALAIYEKSYGKDHPSYATTLHNLAIINQETENYEVAEEQLIETLAIREKVLGKQHPDYAFTLAGLAVLHHHKNDFEKAAVVYKPTIAHYLNQINKYFPALSEKEKSAFFNKIKPVFESYYDFSITYYLISGNVEVLKDMYDLQLSTKAILLNAANKVRNRILGSGDEELIKLYNEWNYTKELLVKAINMTAQEQIASDISLDEIGNRINTLEKELSLQSQLFSNTFQTPSVTWQDVQNSLQDNEAAIEIIRIPKRFIEDSVMYAALIVKHSGDPVAVIMPQGNSLDSRYYNFYRNSIQYSTSDLISYDNYWKPISEQLNGIEQSFVSTDGIYNKISLPTLYSSTTQKFLLDEVDIRLVSNTKELTEPLVIDSIDHKSAVVFGSPDFDLQNSLASLAIDADRTRMFGFSEEGIPALPGTKEEANNLKNILENNNWDYKIYIEEDATEENFKNVKNPAILHVATHGFFMSDLDKNQEVLAGSLNNPEANPLFRSGILLTGAALSINDKNNIAGEDGILSAYEAMNLNLDETEIVILSACETGLGEIKNGEGVYGLQRSLIVAGANSILMSLWKVNDETTMELMTYFYENLLTGKNKFDAFKEAQLKLRSMHEDPYHWGAFVMLGK